MGTEEQPINGTKIPTYIGTKVVNAYPQTHHDSLKSRGFDTPNPDQSGYCVIYEDGYTSWSPKDVFERCYREITAAEKAMM